MLELLFKKLSKLRTVYKEGAVSEQKGQFCNMRQFNINKILNVHDQTIYSYPIADRLLCAELQSTKT